MTPRRLHHAAAVALVLSLTLAGWWPASPPPARAAEPTAWRFGAVEAYRAADQARAARLGWERIIFAWRSIQPTSPADWNAGYFPDDLLARSLADGREVVGLLIGTPDWASPGGRAVDVPSGLYLSPDDPRNHWAQFVRRIVAAYRGRIRTWIVWNEPDIWDSSHSGYQWAGSVADYYQLVKTASLVAKGVDPGVQISLAGLTYWWDAQYGREPYLRRLLAVARADPGAAAHGWHFDVVALQLYNDPIGLYEIPLGTRRLLAEMLGEPGAAKPIWVNETNVAPYDDPVAPLTRAHFRASQDEQAAYTIQAAAAALAGGVERLSYYKMRDDPAVPPGAETFGLVRADGSPRPAYDALRVVTRYLDGARRATLRRAGPVVEVAVERPGERVSVVWNAGPAPAVARLAASSTRARLVDRSGRETPVAASGGEYALALPPATHNTAPGAPQRYLAGGGPLLLVERVERVKGAAAGTTEREQADAEGSPALARPRGSGSSAGEDPTSAWVAPTGQTVSGEWLAFLRANGDTDSFGYPRGPVGREPATGRWIQCFQRAVLEWHPERGPGERIQRRLLGDLLDPGADPPHPPADAPPGPSQYFPLSPERPTGLGHFVADYTRSGQPIDFKQFFDGHGGVTAFGYPKEEPKLRGGRWTQRFQAAVFEHHPELERLALPPRSERVQLELLGERYAAAGGFCPSALAR